MDFEQELKRVAGTYTAQGYQVVVEPRPDDLPSFAKDFKVELVGKRAAEGVLVAVKKNRDAMAADANLPRYAELTSAQPGWRFDFAILESEEPGARELRGAQELPDEDVIKALGDAEQLAPTGFLRPALTTAWAGFEAAARVRRDGRVGHVAAADVERTLFLRNCVCRRIPPAGAGVPLAERDRTRLRLPDAGRRRCTVPRRDGPATSDGVTACEKDCLRVMPVAWIMR